MDLRRKQELVQKAALLRAFIYGISPNLPSDDVRLYIICSALGFKSFNSADDARDSSLALAEALVLLDKHKGFVEAMNEIKDFGVEDVLERRMEDPLPDGTEEPYWTLKKTINNNVRPPVFLAQLQAADLFGP